LVNRIGLVKKMINNNNKIGFGTTFASFPTQALQNLKSKSRDKLNAMLRDSVELASKQNNIFVGMSEEGLVFDKMTIINKGSGVSGVCFMHNSPKKDKKWYNEIRKIAKKIKGASVQHMKDKETPESQTKFIKLHKKWMEHCLFLTK